MVVDGGRKRTDFLFKHNSDYERHYVNNYDLKKGRFLVCQREFIH
ncbi:MAG: hypothetical protein PHQ98_03620 [Candidatus ainarchaeum sp.]|nr:hypothetical protein [Candidatus ainarchaeum sp.]